MTLQGGNIEEDGKLLKPFFNRVGNKVPLIRDILEIIPPHTTYVEAFVGGGALFWNKIPAKKSVINDLDKELIEGYRILKRIPTSVDMTILDNSKQVGKKFPAVEKFINSVTSKSSDRDKLIALTEKYAGTFGSMGQGGIYKNPSMENRWKKIDQYKALLKPTTIVSKDYLKVLKDYDSPTTFFFLDPPYEVEKKGQEKYYKHSIIDYDKMNEALKQLKGKFLLTINDSKYISDIFKDFNQKTLIVRNPSQSGISKEAQNRKELFISNYNMKLGKGIETDLFEEEDETKSTTSLKSSKAKSVASVDTMSSDDLDLYLLDREAFNKKYGLSGKGLENKISTNNKMPNKWITYVKEYASKNGMSYRDALKDPKCKAGYKKG